jgi:hypothetical protein
VQHSALIRHFEEIGLLDRTYARVIGRTLGLANIRSCLLCGRTRKHRTYTVVYSADVQWGTTDRTKFGYSQENEPLGRIALRKYRDRTTENGLL